MGVNFCLAELIGLCFLASLSFCSWFQKLFKVLLTRISEQIIPSGIYFGVKSEDSITVFPMIQLNDSILESTDLKYHFYNILKPSEYLHLFCLIHAINIASILNCFNYHSIIIYMNSS